MYDAYGKSLLKKLNIPSHLSFGRIVSKLQHLRSTDDLTRDEMSMYVQELYASAERYHIQLQLQAGKEFTLYDALMLFSTEPYEQVHEDRDPTHVQGLVRDLREPEAAENQCFRVSEKFHNYLTEKGIESKLIMARGYRIHGLSVSGKSLVLPDNFKCVDDANYQHTVVVAEGKWIDWSARQMDANSDFPYVKPYVVEARNWNEVGRLTNDVDLIPYVKGIVNPE